MDILYGSIVCVSMGTATLRPCMLNVCRPISLGGLMGSLVSLVLRSERVACALESDEVLM